MTTSVAVALVTHNSSELLPDCLAAIPAAMESIEEYEVVVVDSGSTDGSLDVATSLFPAASTVDLGANLGYASGINAAARASSADMLLALNPDVRLAPGSVARLRSALAAPGVGITVPTVVSPEGDLDYSLRRAPTIRRALGEALLGGRLAGRWSTTGEVVRNPSAYRAPCDADWAVGAVMLISRACFDAVDGWDESFFLYSEETDFALRARDAGFRLRFVPEARAVHLRGDAGVSPHLWSILTVNRARMFERRNGRARAGAFRAALLLNEALRAPTSVRHRAALRALLRDAPPRPASTSG